MSQRQPRSHLFVSYSRSDRIAVDKLVADLRERGYLLWMDVDVRGIEPGEDWRNELVTQMSTAEGVIACISPDYLGSPNCKAEIEQALSEHKPIYPLLIRRLDTTHSLDEFKIAHIQYTDLSIGYDLGLQRLLAALPSPQLPLRRVARFSRVAIAVIVIVVLAFIGVMLATQQGFVRILPTATPIPPTPTIALADYDVGVIVSYFVVDPADAIPQDDADAIVANFANSLDSQVASELGSTGLTYKLDGPVGVPRIEGDSPSERGRFAAVEANKRNATIAIYGVIRRDSTLQQTLLEPEFSVVSSRYFNDAEDITGNYAFGSSIRTNSPERNDELKARVTALSYVVVGLSNHMTQHYEDALDAYQLALAVPDWGDAGREIVYGLQGNAYMKLAEQSARQCDRAATLAHTDEAEAAYEASRTLAEHVNPDFEGRVYAGLANVYAVRAVWLPETNTGCTTNGVDRAALEQASQYVDSFQQYLLMDLDGSVRRKMLLTAVQVRYLQWLTQPQADRNASDNPAYQALDDAVNATLRGFDANDPESTWAFPVMEAHYFRALAEIARGQFPEALDDCDAALVVYNTPRNQNLLAPERAMAVNALKGFAYDRMGAYADAVQAYGDALDQARALNIASAIATYQQQRQNATYRLLGTQTITAPTAAPTPETTAPAEEGATAEILATLAVSQTPSPASS